MAAPRSKPAKASWAHWAALTRINCGGPPVMPPAEPATSSNSLSTGPGQTWVTTTPVPSRSARKASLKPSTKCLLAEYAAEQGITVNPAPDPMLSTPPAPRSTMLHGDESGGQAGHGHNIGRQHLAGAAPLRPVVQGLVPQPSVVDQDVDVARLMVDLGQGPLDIVGVRQVSGHDDHP